MTVGEALKQERKNLNLTQSAMAAEVISPSFYSKVENNLHEINVNDLLAILDAHCIDIPSFFMKIDSKVKTDYFNLNTFTDRVLDIWYNKDLKQLAELQTELTKYTGNDVSFLNLQVELLTFFIKNERNAKLSDSLMQKLRAELFKQNVGH
ncbi:helix-turn-helix transcriptional regulator [Lactobacillus mulieris]|uniref:helix-turn-helix domain-containing protein n=1 Tax=Lactobacillus mulieris TaxID=2508708 RepID=UPI002242FFD1|nr:helix-turn-helix transcriptional regulator [Lactobacillus mulieris]MCW8106450.1 helix-turn-helix transcriptional regulator [Lactobacillus mulieris]MDK7349386.1 helix-turn-helix transcriptional regulator [Lactobacillus mulieris]